jgi:cbb3-type cytochrome oxidase subunit 3
MLSGVLIALLIGLFLGIFAWAYTPGRRQRFSEAAALALFDDVIVEASPNVAHAELEQAPRSARTKSRSVSEREESA